MNDLVVFHKNYCPLMSGLRTLDLKSLLLCLLFVQRSRIEMVVSWSHGLSFLWLKPSLVNPVHDVAHETRKSLKIHKSIF